VFLFHAIKAGLDMGIVNAGALVPYDSIDPELRDPNRGRRPEPSRGCGREAPGDRGTVQTAPRRPTTRWQPSGAACRSRERITHALVKGIDADVETDTEELRAEIAVRRWSPDRGDRGPADGTA